MKTHSTFCPTAYKNSRAGQVVATPIRLPRQAHEPEPAHPAHQRAPTSAPDPAPASVAPWCPGFWCGCPVQRRHGPKQAITCAPQACMPGRRGGRLSQGGVRRTRHEALKPVACALTSFTSSKHLCMACTSCRHSPTQRSSATTRRPSAARSAGPQSAACSCSREWVADKEDLLTGCGHAGRAARRHNRQRHGAVQRMPSSQLGTATYSQRNQIQALRPAHLHGVDGLVPSF